MALFKANAVMTNISRRTWKLLITCHPKFNHLTYVGGGVTNGITEMTYVFKKALAIQLFKYIYLGQCALSLHSIFGLQTPSLQLYVS